MLAWITKVKLSTVINKYASKLLVFAGQGTQELNMLDPLLNIPEAKKQIQHYSQLLNIDFIGITHDKDKQQQLKSTDNVQPLIVMQQCLRLKYLWRNNSQDEQYINKYGIHYGHTLIGHSIGEYSALVAAGAISLEQCIKLVHKRGKMMIQYTNQPSAMLFIRFNDQKQDKLSEILQTFYAQISCFNTAHNIIIGGQKEYLTQIQKQLKLSKITSIFLPISSAFHCKMLQPMKMPYKKQLQLIQFKDPICRIIRNYDMLNYESRADIIEGLVQHLTNPVRFYQSIKMIDQEWAHRSLLDYEEIGHKQHLSKFIKQIRKNTVK